MSNKHLKSQEKNVKISKPMLQKRRGADCDQTPAFSFKYLTTNNKHNFDYFTKSMRRDMLDAKHFLMEKLLEITQGTWLQSSGMRKLTGFETMPKNEVEFSPNQYELTSDAKYTIFHFGIGRRDHRIIGFRIDSCPIYYIAGYDFDFSAYDHG